MLARHAHPVIKGSLLAVAMIGLLALACAALMDPLTGALVALVLLLGLLAYHVRNLVVLAEWAGDRSAHALVPTRGMWRAVFEHLNARARDAREHREGLSVALERFRAASQAMPDGVIYLSANGTIEWMNARAEQHFGLDHNRDVGVMLVGLVRHRELLAHLNSNHAGAPVLMQSPRRPAIRLQVQTVPFGDGQRMVISRDITQIERLETMRQDFIANVSHELRTPLTVVGGFIETVQDGLDDLPREDIQRFLGMAHDQSARMRRLIDDLLALSALETGAPAPMEERVEVIELIRQVVEESELLSGGRHSIVFEVEPACSGDVLIGSEKELYSVFANLASNAVRYTPAGGHIVIQWQRGRSGGVYSVSDDGLGIDPAHIPRLTERFFRADRGRSRETGGTGLGLAIVKHIVQRHQAELRIESELGKGSRFSVSFPASRLKRAR